MHLDVIDFLTNWSVRSTERSVVHVRVQSGMNLPESNSHLELELFWVTAKCYLDQHPSAQDTLSAIVVADSSLRLYNNQSGTLCGSRNSGILGC